VKTGGLADVIAALGAALTELGHDVRLLLPGYPAVLAATAPARRVIALGAPGGYPDARLLETSSPAGFPMWVLDCPSLYAREGNPYLDPSGRDWEDNAIRFGLLSCVAARIASDAALAGWRCDVLHCHDWQAGLAPAYLRWGAGRRTPSVMTVHNLAYQGVFPSSTLPRVGLPPESFTIDGVEYYGSLSFLKAGLVYADRIGTVSPSYAREIQEEALGFGLHGLVSARSGVLDGILNGVDTHAWNPADDSALAARYDAGCLDAKAENTRALRRRLGLAGREAAPLLGVVSRLVHQKGLDLVAELADRIVSLPAQLVVLGTGDQAIERAFEAAAARHPGDVARTTGFDEALSHLIEAGADIFLMPSRFEPCGLNQMYSQRYGTPPVVRRTGGLADSVVDANPSTLADGSASGFVFDEATPQALFAAIERAVMLWRDRPVWRAVQRNGMARDFSWSASARRYVEAYEKAIGAR